MSTYIYIILLRICRSALFDKLMYIIIILSYITYYTCAHREVVCRTAIQPPVRTADDGGGGLHGHSVLPAIIILRAIHHIIFVIKTAIYIDRLRDQEGSLIIMDIIYDRGIRYLPYYHYYLNNNCNLYMLIIRGVY